MIIVYRQRREQRDASFYKETAKCKLITGQDREQRDAEMPVPSRETTTCELLTDNAENNKMLAL